MTKKGNTGTRRRVKVEAAFARDAGVDRRQALAEALLDPVAQQEARDEEGQRGAEAGGERHQQRAPQQAEHRAAGQRHDRRAGQRQRGDGDVDGEEDRRRQPGVGDAVGLDRRLLRLEGF
jgi:hypothetical protein